MENQFSKRAPAVTVALVVGMIAVLVAVGGLIAVLYSFYASEAHSEANRLRSMNNMKQIVLALGNYEIMYRGLPAHASYGADGQPLLSWRVLVLPYLEETDQPGLQREFHMDEPWDSPHNRQLIAKMPAVFQNPDFNAEPGHTNYLAVVCDDCAFDGTPEGKRANLIAADSPRSILLVEADAPKAVPWTKPDDLQFDRQNPTFGLESFRPEGWLAAWADGSVTAEPTGGDQVPAESFVIPTADEANEISP